DNGKGIDEETKSHLFEAGVKENSESPRAGLGLSIAKAIVVAHGGSIRLEDSPNGTCFRIEIQTEGQDEGLA
ncbi:MAG: ATP-binding protein, partial [Acidimicrobiales bacterium]